MYRRPHTALRLLLPAFLLPLFLCFACGGGHQKALLKQMEELTRELAQLKSSSVNNTVLMEDVQNKILLLEDQVESNRLLLSRTSLPAPVLPVVKLRPATGEIARGEAAASQPASVESMPVISFQDLTEAGLIVDMSGNPPPDEKKAAAVEPRPTRKRFDSRPIEKYKHATDLLKKKRHGESVAEFENFLEQYPNHDYSDNALYWMGEAYYDSQNYGKALECFQKVVTLYPTGNKVPDALLKAGLCYANVGDKGAAREVMGQLLDYYPSSRAAGIAQEKLDALQ